MNHLVSFFFGESDNSLKVKRAEHSEGYKVMKGASVVYMGSKELCLKYVQNFENKD